MYSGTCMHLVDWVGDLVKCPVYCGTPLYCGHLGDLVKCPVYSGASLLWTYFGHLGDLMNCPVYSGTPHIVDTLRTW